MIVAEIIALVAVVLGGAALLKAVWAWIDNDRHRAKERREIRNNMTLDLRCVLGSRDYRLYDDFMATWAGIASPEQMRHVKQRRNELFVDSNA